MFKIPNIPSPQANPNDLADFIELECIKKNIVSARDIIAALNRLSDNDHSDGVDEEDTIDYSVEAAFSEIEDRIKFSNYRYPFELDTTGSILTQQKNGGDIFYWLYLYLLLATRLNMKDFRTYAGIDGSLLFEELSAEIAKNYLGDRAQALVFGTASGAKDFPEKINNLCFFLEEGGCFKQRDISPPTAKDGKLDIVVLKHFSDKRSGKLIGFGQCKTGTSWKDTLAQLQPQSFCTKWLTDMPIITPIRLFFLCEALSKSTWHTNSSDAGILFDRCRFMDYSENVSEHLSEKILLWTKAAVKHFITAS